jgi:outer membrane protein assembly factor BamD
MYQLLYKLRGVAIPMVLLFMTSFGSGCGKKPVVDLYQGLSASTIYTQGRLALKNKKYQDAIKDFEELEARYPYDMYTDKAQLSLIYAHFEQGNYTQALSVAERFIRIHPQHQHVDYAYYMRGMVRYQENFSTVYRYFPIERALRDPSLASQAFANFKSLITHCPRSKYAADAYQRLVFLKEQLAAYEYSVAEYYFDQKAYVATSNRVIKLLGTLQGTTYTQPALALLVKTYQAMKMPALAKQAAALLEKEVAHTQACNK